MDRLFYDASRAAVQRDHIQMQQENVRLKARNAQLEQVVREALPLMEAAWDGHVSLHPTKDFNAWTAESWIVQAKALLEQEVN